METNVSRKLAAIMVADIFGYSRLMNADESRTHKRVQRLMREIVEPSVLERGRIVKTQGDGFLALFDSPVEAVRCAIVIQQNMLAQNLELQKSDWIQFRIGINLGDIIVDGHDIYGEGVNIAARLEQLAEPGKIYISGGMYEQVKHKIVCGYQALGDKKVKNITDPVAIYRVHPDPASVKSINKKRRVLTSSIIAIMFVGGVGAFSYMWISHKPTQQQVNFIDNRSVINPNAKIVGTAYNVPLHLPNETKKNEDKPIVSPLQETGLRTDSDNHVNAIENLSFLAPEMVNIPAGTFHMGSNEDSTEKPIHEVSIAAFSLARFPVTVREWNLCVTANVCKSIGSDMDGNLPAYNISWNDAQQYIDWLSQKTGNHYRLPTEAEWEYAARAGSKTNYWWGDAVVTGMADCKGCGSGAYDPKHPKKVGMYPPNAFGLYDMVGSVTEWVQDCWHRNYHGAPNNGSAWSSIDCREYVIRGGSWRNDSSYARSASREFYDASVRYATHGFRLAKSP